MVGVETGEYPNRFGRGAGNLLGLRLALNFDGESVAAEFTPESRREGWPGIARGGDNRRHPVRSDGEVALPERRGRDDAADGHRDGRARKGGADAPGDILARPARGP